MQTINAHNKLVTQANNYLPDAHSIFKNVERSECASLQWLTLFATTQNHHTYSKPKGTVCAIAHRQKNPCAANWPC